MDEYRDGDINSLPHIAGDGLCTESPFPPLDLPNPEGKPATPFQSKQKNKDLRARHGLPRVGERVRSKHFGTVWKIIEEKEIWMKGPNKHPIPGIFVKYWREDTASAPGTGRTMSYRYSHNDPPFDNYWEILYDW